MRDWRKPVFSLLARITGQPAAVEQLAQQTFAEAFTQVSGATDPDLRLILFRIGTRVAIRFLHRSPGNSFPALDALPPEQRALVVLAEVERLPLEAACRILDIAADDAERRLVQVRRMIARPLAAKKHAA